MENLKIVFNLQTILSNAGSGVIISKYDEKLTISHKNDVFCDLIGYSHEEIEKIFGNSFKAIKQQSKNEEWDLEQKKDLAISEKYELIYKLIRKDGSQIWIKEDGLCFDGEDGEKYIQAILTNITHQKKAEENYNDLKIKHDLAMEYSNISMYKYNVRNRTISTNEADFERFGIPSFVDSSIDEVAESGIIAEKSKKTFYAMYKEIDEGAPKAQRIVYAYDSQGNERILELRLTTVFDKEGKPESAIGLRKDITANFLQERENEYSKIQMSNDILICEVNLQKDYIIQFDKNWKNDLELTEFLSFKQLIENICEKNVFEDDKANFIKFFNKKNIILSYKKGERSIALEFRSTENKDDCKWYRIYLNIIRDRISNELIIRCYIRDITDEKQKEIKRLEEKRLIQSLIVNTKIAYVINLTKNQIISGHEEWESLYNIKVNYNYEEMIELFAKKVINTEDSANFYDAFQLKNVINAFSSGMDSIRCEYRCPDESGEFKWRRCTFHIFEDPNTRELMGEAYIEDINDEKERELELIYNAQHDMLTGLYNRATTEKYIKEYLLTDEGKNGFHAFFTLDIDYFKGINDTFGHAFGDAVLFRTASKINEVFRGDDILGRIGGDEFVVFLKKVQSPKVVLSKAQELCEICRDSFLQGTISHHISISIGIAFYRDHGESYEDLYLHSDAALYISKENGRNRFTVYSENMVIQNSNDNEIYENQILEPRDFKKNIAEYAFRILYESNDKVLAINSVLQLMGKHFDVSRAYVFEESQFHDYSTNTFEWCNTNIEPFSDRLRKIPKQMLAYNDGKFNENGIFFAPDVSKLPEKQRERLEIQNIKTLIQFSIVIKGEFVGFIGFDECRAVKIPSKKQVSDMQNVANILGVFISEMRGAAEKDATKNVIMSIINGLGSFAYVLEPDTYRIIFLNDKTLKALPDAKVGGLCYQAMWDRDTPCDNCPMKIILESGEDHIVTHMEGSKLAPWIKSTASWIYWSDNKKVCLVDNIDITEYK